LAPYTIAIIGVGKIARDQHLPVIARHPRFQLAGVVSQSGASVEDAPTFATAAEAYAALPDLDAVAICTPPNIRHHLARQALDAGKHVLLEKPPAPTLAEMHDLTALAATRQRVVFAAGHSQYNEAVDEARRRLAGRRIARLAIEWTEDVRQWHPRQEWVWEAGNFGVFDAGINALSILTKIAPAPMSVTAAALYYPANRETPIAASLAFSSSAAAPEAPLSAEFDWRRDGGQNWRIDVDLVDGPRLSLIDGGARLLIDGALVWGAPKAEYDRVYDRFVDLIAEGVSAMDCDAFQLVADAFALGARRNVEPFHW
jgi:D-galactose 1-dehydrogenase